MVETVIVGGGPAGSSCAWELKRSGRDVLILERQELPKFKLCAGWITPAVLGDLAIETRDYPFGILKLDRIRLYWGRSPFSITFATKQYSIRRVEFDNWLLQRSGAEIARHSVRSIEVEGGCYVIDGEFRCKYLVGAGGTRCPVKRILFGPDEGRLILTQETEYETADVRPTCTLFYPFGGFAGYGWYVPKTGGVNIGFGGMASQFQSNIKSYWPGFVRLLKRRGLIDSDPPEPSSHPYYAGHRRQTHRLGNAFIAGDAAGLATFDLGEGIGPAVRSGLMVAQQILGAGGNDPEGIPEYSLSGIQGKILGRLNRTA